MAIDFDTLRKKAKKRDEEKQKKDAYEYSRSMYEGAKKNRSNVSANTYKLYYDDYIKNTKAYKNEQKKGINDERKSQLKAVLNMINPLDSVSASKARKNYKSAQKEKEKKQSAYDKLKEEYETLNGSKQKKNLLMSEIGKVGETLYGNPYNTKRKNEVKQIYNKSKQEAYEQQAYDADIKQKAREETAAKNKNALSKDKGISKKAEQAYRYRNAIAEKSKASGADDMSSAMLNAMGVGSKGKNDVDYSKKYNDSLKELQSLINKKGYKDIKAEDLIDYYIANKNNEQQAKVIKGAEKAAQEHPVIMQAARTLTSPLRAQANIANTIDMAVNGKSSINGTADFITNAAYGTRKGLEDKAANDGLINLAGKKIGPISVNKNNEIEILGNNMGNVNAALYDNIDQMAENVYNSLLFGGGITGGITASGKAEKAKQALINGVFSTAAMGDDMSSQLASGSSSGETIKSSVKGALINFLTEMVGAPLEWADVKGSSTFGKILVSGLNEGTEEIIGNVVDRTYDQITQGQLSELSQLKRSYLEQGLNEQEADKEVVKSMLAEDIFAALQAGFAGAVMSGSEIAPNNIIESVQNNIDNKKLGAEAKAQSNSDIQAIIDEGLSKNKNSKAYKYAEELQAKVKTSQANGDVLAGASIYDEADYSKINEKRLGQLQTEIVKEGFKENIATAIEGEKNEDRINKAISKMVNGFELSRYDVKAIKDSEKAINAINEQFGSDFTDKDISNDSLEALSAKLKNGYTDYSFTYGGYSKYQQRAENAQNAVLEENTPNVSGYTQKSVETFTAEQQSDDPKYNVNAVAITSNGNQAAVKIYGRHPFEVSTDRSNFKVKTSAGDIDYNNISLENQTQQVLTNEIINKNFGNSGANAVFVNFDPNNLKGASVSTYVSQAKMLYDLGVAKPDVPFNEFVMRNPAFYPAVKFLGDKAINIYRSGQTDAKSYDTYIEEQRKNKKSPTKATRHIEGEYKNISDSDSTIDDVFIEVARKTRVDIERHSDGRQGGNGQFIPSLAKIIINADGSGEYNALIHELGEFGLAYNEKEYKNVQSAIRDWYVSYKGADNFNSLVDAYIDTYTKAEGSKTRAEAIDELTNDAVSGLFSTDEGVEQFAKWLSDNKTEAEKKSIIETIADFLKSVIEKIKNVIATSNLQTAAKDAMEMEQKRANHIRKQFLNMLDNASENLYGGVEAENNTKYSLDSYNKKQIDSFKNSNKIELYHSKEQLQKFVNDARQHKNLNKKMYFGVISNEMAEYIKNETGVDVKGYNVALRADNILKIFNSHGNETFELSRGQRAITDEDILKLPQLLNNIDYAEYAGKYNGMQNSNNDFINLKSSKDDTITIGAFKQKKYLDLRIHTMYAKNKGNNDDTANAKALASTSETSVGNVSFNSSISKYSDNVKKFSLSVPIEETKELVAIHNTTESKLLSALELGGLPSPSIAIMKAQNISANNEFGDISLVFDKKTIDPQESNANKVYSSDAYTPISVKAEHKLNEKKAWDLYSKINNLVKQKLAYKPNASSFHPDNFKDQVDGAGSIAELVNKYKNDYAFKELYLADKSEPVRDIAQREKKTTLTSEDTDVFDFLNDNIKDTLQEIDNKPLLPSRLWVEKYDSKIKQSIADYYKSLIPGISDENIDNIFNNSDEIKTAFQRKAFVKKAIDYLKNGAEKVELVSDDEATHNLIDNKINQKEYESWLNDLFDGVVEKKGIWKGNDPFDESGERKNWENLYWDYNLENIVKAMNNQNAQGGNFLVSNIIGGSAKKYNNLDEVRNDKSRLQNVNDEEYNQIRNNLYKRFQEIAQSMTKNDNPFAVADIIVDGVAKTETKSGLANYLKTELKGWANYSDMAVDDIWTLVNDIRALPTSYFEAKPQRAVYFNEVYTAVIPDNASQKLKNALKNAGVSYAEYKANNEQSRLDVVNSLEDIRFSRDVNIDEFDETEYTNVKLSKAKYNKLYSEALTWDSDKVGQICYKCFNNKRYYYILNEDYDIKILGVYNSNDKKGAEYKNVDRKRRNISSRHEVSENTNGNDRSHNGFVSNGRTATNNAELNKEEIQREGDGNRTRIVENDDNDNLSEEKYSRDVDYAEYAELKRENKHLKEINEVLKHQFELTNGREVSTNSLLKAARKIIKLTPTRMTGVDVAKEMKSWHTLDTSQQFFNAAYDLANKLVENEKQIKYQPTQEEQEMLDYLKNTEIKLSDKQKEEVSYYFGTYGKYKNAARGKINITENGIPLDDLANEMEELFGGLMPSDNSQDMPIALLDMVNTYKDKVIENDYGYSKEEYLESLANDILSYYFKTNLYETKADKNEKRFLKARSKYAQQISNYQKLLADEKAKHKKEFSEFRKEQVHKNQQYRSDLYRDTIQYKAEFRKNFKEEKLKAEYRKRIKRNLLRLASLAKQTKTKHIPNNMVESVRDLCYTVTTDTKFDDKILDKVKNLNDSFTRLSADKTDTYHYITNLYNEWLMKDLAALENSIGNKTVAMLNSTELSKLDDIISMTLTTIGKANKLFGYERNKTIEKSVSKVKEEIESISVKQINNRYLRSLGYNSMKPEYFFEYLGSDELLKLYRDVRKGEDTWAVTISDSKNFADDIREKYNWKSWNFDKITEYKSLLGEKLKFDLQDLMSLYAFSRREQAKNHILHGGIKFADTKNKKKSNEYSTHKLSKQDLKYLTNLLTEEQKAYVRDMVKYLSTDMAEKGNEVTRQLYDVELFKEENYFPMKVDGDSVKEKSTEVKGTKKIKNSGMTNATVEGAKQALILNGFDSVWAGHVDEMAKYHAFTLPLENFDKVYNYSDIDDSDNLTSIKEKIENNYGNEAISYISKLIENINGGVVREPGTDIADKFVSMFKKNAVFASASVAIQQPSAIGRALSIIDSKYFAKTTFTKRSYDEIKKYAPVAIIKEMGYFDTNMAQSTVDYINNVDYKGKEKIAAFFKDGAFRDEVFGYTASKADEITWSHIWNACKAEAKDKYPNLSTEESLQKAGERFTEVITKTQVYDSVFSRSALMRSKNGAVKMATAFMAEPTTSLNMLVNATVQAKRGKFSKKKATRIVASLVIASVINALLQSIVTAARNDDDDKTYAEKYIAELIPNFIDNANPVNQIAFLKDAISVFQGYDVTRADMSVVSDLYNSIHNLNSDNLTYTQKIESLAGSIGAFFGLPIKNVIRDINSVENVIKGAKNGNSFNPSMAKEATQSEIKEALLTDDVLAVFGLDLFPEKDKQQMIYEAIMDGNNDMYKRIADNVSNPDNYIKKGLIENDERVAAAGLAYLDGDIGTAINTAKELESDGFDYELAYKAIKAYSSEIQKAAGYKADSDDKKYKQSLETLISSGTDKETVEKAIDTVEIDEKQDSKDSKLYNKTDLINALNSGDKSVLKTVIDGNIATDISNGKTKTEAEKSIKSSLKSAFKEEYLAADNSKRSQIKTKLKSTGYFDDEDFTNWEASSYNTEAMVEAFKSNDTKNIRNYVDNRIKAKVANGMTQDNAVFGIRTSITNQYKAKFINGNADEKAKIITIMTKTGLYGNRTDVINYINKYWLK
nr:MAG TPA: nuclease [Caudoviricetes sp.]